MKYKVRITLNAKNDIKEAVSFYESKKDGLGKEFLTAFKSYKKQLSSIVTARIWYKSIRGFPMKRFPYTLFYSIDESVETIFITAVFCQYKNPDTYPV
jgi:toxin ParE1/3/4